MTKKELTQREHLERIRPLATKKLKESGYSKSPENIKRLQEGRDRFWKNKKEQKNDNTND